MVESMSTTFLVVLIGVEPIHQPYESQVRTTRKHRILEVKLGLEPRIFGFAIRRIKQFCYFTVLKNPPRFSSGGLFDRVSYDYTYTEPPRMRIYSPTSGRVFCINVDLNEYIFVEFLIDV
jgi:hypothetical protein